MVSRVILKTLVDWIGVTSDRARIYICVCVFSRSPFKYIKKPNPKNNTCAHSVYMCVCGGGCN